MALRGSRKYWGFLFFLCAVIAAGGVCWFREHALGSGLTTGLSQDVPWGLHIGQLTFFVGVAASAVMVVLPYYLHSYKEFGQITVIGEFLAVSAVIVSMLSVFTIMGRPERVLNVLLHPTPNSIIFWDMIVLSTYLILNFLCGWIVLSAERKGVAPPKWIKPVIFLTIIWGPSIHMVTAFLYAGLPGKPHWMTALQTVHFFATAFAAGPCLLILLGLILRKVGRLDVGARAIQKLATIATYALILHLLFIGLEFFTAFYSQEPGHVHSLQYMYSGLDGHSALAPVVWTSSALALLGLILIGIPRSRRKEPTLALGAVAVFLSIWFDKGFAFVADGFVPNAFGEITEYRPHWNEFVVAAGVLAAGVLVFTVLCKIVVSVREELNAQSPR
jgi:molybdopterin-containing oxidoreductase family membrane subunit